MNIDSITNFFMWCSIINGILLIFWTVWYILAPDLVYRIQSKWFPISKSTFDLVIYTYLGLFKIFFIIFNLVPFISLKIIT